MLVRVPRLLSALACALVASSCGYITDAELKDRLDLDGDGIPRPDDCDDNDPDVGILSWYVDADRDGYGDPDAPLEQACEQRAGMAAIPYDCDDTTARINPVADELCNFVDDDCDGAADNDAVDPSPWYLDSDGDGLGDETVVAEACVAPAGFVRDPGDCDDDDPELLAGRIWYADEDNDGWGDSVHTTFSCEGPEGWTRRAGDCDDSRADVHPGAVEVCDLANADEDCDGFADDEDPSGALALTFGLWYEDRDSDGFGSAIHPVERCDVVEGLVENRDDCDDTSPTITDSDCPWLQVSAGSVTTCGVLGDHRAHCWGLPAIVDAVPDGIFRQVAVGLTHACAITVDDRVECWGAVVPGADDTTEVLSTIDSQADNTCGLTDAGALICWNSGVEYRLGITGHEFTSVVAGSSHSCGLLDDGAVRCVGSCFSDECAEQAGPFDEIAAGARVSCGLTEGGEAECWGNTGLLSPPAGPLEGLVGYSDQFCALAGNGSAMCWDRSGTTIDLEITGAVSLTVGQEHVCALTARGEILCVGDDTFGQSTVPAL